MTNEPTPPATPDGADPSMEDILASIRRILNEDETPAVSADGSGAPPAEDDVLVLDQSMIVPDVPAPAAEGAPAPVAPAPAEPVPIAAPPEAAPPRQETQPIGQPGPREVLAPHTDLLAPEAAAAASSSVGSLMRTLAAGRATQVYSGGPTLEDIVRAELRPLLKEWLDGNLPPLVERLVRAEIERVIGRGL